MCFSVFSMSICHRGLWESGHTPCSIKDGEWLKQYNAHPRLQLALGIDAGGKVRSMLSNLHDAL